MEERFECQFCSEEFDEEWERDSHEDFDCELNPEHEEEDEDNEGEDY